MIKSKPPFLVKNDKIGIIAPARKISSEEISFSLKVIKGWGLDPILGKSLFNIHNQFAGNDTERAQDFQDMLDDPSIKAILCARGGYGTIRLVEQLDFTSIKNNPKWIIGYSDITVIHSLLNRNCHLQSIHGIMPVNIKKHCKYIDSINSLRDILFGKNCEYTIKFHPFNVDGNEEAELVGGNLSILYSLRGTPYDIDTEGKILIIEDVDEYLYHLDRIIMNFKIGGKLDRLKGLVIGTMSEMNDNTIPFGKTANEIIAEHCKTYTFPRCFNFPIGHTAHNLAIRLGSKIKFHIVKQKGRLTYL